MAWLDSKNASSCRNLSYRRPTRTPPASPESDPEVCLHLQAPPRALKSECEITHTYRTADAHKVIRRTFVDYQERFGSQEEMLTAALQITRG